MATSLDRRDCFWLATEERGGWFRSPLRNADSSPQAWGEGGVLLNGGGYQYNSWGSHKVYQYEWGAATPFPYAQKLKSYFDGTYGRGLVYFYDPLIYQYNVLPARWADPSMALDNEGTGLVYGVEPTVATDDFDPTINDYPIRGVTYNLATTASGWRGREDALYLPIPEGYTLVLGAAGSTTGAGRLMYRTSNRGALNVSVGSLVMLSDSGSDIGGYGVDAYGVEGFGLGTANKVVNTYIPATSTVSGVWLSVGKVANGAGTVTLHGITARLVKTTLIQGEFSLGYGLDPYGSWPYGAYSPYSEVITSGPWSGGMGHAGTRFTGPPTFSTTGPGMHREGQAGFAATFREVGSYAYA
jgi:hypothetical protein